MVGLLARTRQDRAETRTINKFKSREVEDQHADVGG